MEDIESIGVVAVLVISLLILGIYLIPTFVAYSRNKESKGWILLVNIFLGWSGICWLIALLWALSNDDKPQQIIIKERKNKLEVNSYDQLIKLNELLEKKIITSEEFEAEKKKLLV